VKANLTQVRAALDRPGPAIRFILLSGPDEAGAREHVDRLARAMGPDAERVELDGPTLRQDPGRLAAEAASLSLFGGARFILVGNVGDDAVAAFDALLQVPVAGNPVIAIGPGLKSTGKLMKLALASPAALSFICYVPSGAEAVQLATAIAASHGLRATAEAARRLVATTGADRALIAREVEKLALFLDAAPDRPALLDESALDALGADLNEGEIASAIDAALVGDRALLGAELVKLSAGGTSAIPVVRGLVRRLMLLAELRAQVDRGASIGEVVERSGVFFREKPVTTQALRHWSVARLVRAIDHLRRAERTAIAPLTAGEVHLTAAMIAVARGGDGATR